MKVTITFVKLMDRWFANLPHLKEKLDIVDCEITSLAASCMDEIAKGKQAITLDIYADEEVAEPNGTLTEISEYLGAGCGDYRLCLVNDDGEEIFMNNIWLCPAVSTVFGYYPTQMYYKYTEMIGVDEGQQQNTK